MNEKILLLMSVVTATLGQILFKKGMSSLDAQGLSFAFRDMAGTLWRILTHPAIFTGLVFYGTSTLLWLFALSKTKLNYVYPFTALTFVLVMLASHFVFAESLPANRLIGVLLICGGFIVAAVK